MKATTLVRELSKFIKQYGDGKIVFADKSELDCIIAGGVNGETYYSLEREADSETVN